MPRSSSSPLFVIFFGAPGSGKGTYSSLMMKDLNFVKFSTGDELRKRLLDKNDEEGRTVRELVEKGKLVTDDLIFGMLEKMIDKNKNVSGIILDGFPRNFTQMKMFEKRYDINLVINCILNEEILIEKLLGRRTCVGCGKAYNICTILKNGYDMPAMPPQKDNICDKCKCELIEREDDKSDIIKLRLSEYEDKTRPLLEYFDLKGVVVNFEPKRGVKDYPDFYEKVIKPKLFG